MSWVGVDLDGTLAVYDGWKGDDHIGDPIPAMVDRVLSWSNSGLEVRILTARPVVKPIEDWCQKHLGRVLQVTDKKDFEMIELWDDRAVRVEKNTGKKISSSEL